MYRQIICVECTVKKSYLKKNRITNFVSGINMEIYFSHMIVFQIVEKLGLKRRIRNGWIQYVCKRCDCVFGNNSFSVVVKRLIGLFKKRFTEIKVKR